MTTAAAHPDTTTGAPAGAPVDLAAPWGGRSRYADLGGPVHWVDFGGPTEAGPGGGAAAPPLVLVHGLGGSHLNWVGVAPALARHRRVVALDLVGFGLTPHEGRSSNVRDNAALVARFVREVVGEPAVLMGNSMGGMISLLVADRFPEVVEALVLVDASLPTPGVRPDRQVLLEFAVYATPFVGERYLQRNAARFTDRQRVLRTVAVCFADPSRADAAVVDAGVELAAWRRTLPGAERAFLGAARSLLRILRSGNRYPALITRVRQPTLLLHGELDKLVPVGAARATAESKPAWEREILAGVGHTPQLEVPDAVVARVKPWLASLPG
jgi:pimeloyl-ACP methyl ester carboxylesterase